MQTLITLIIIINLITSDQSLSEIFVNTQKKICKIDLIDNLNDIALINTIHYSDNVTDVLTYISYDLNFPPNQSLIHHSENPFLNITDMAYNIAYMWELNNYMIYNEENYLEKDYLEKKNTMKKQLIKKLKNSQLGFTYNEINKFIEEIETYDKTQIFKIIKTGGSNDDGLELITVKLNKNNLENNIYKTLLQYPIRLNFRNYKLLKNRNIIKLFFFMTLKTNKPINQYKTPIYQLTIKNNRVLNITEIISTTLTQKYQDDNNIQIPIKIKQKWKKSSIWNQQLILGIFGLFFLTNIIFLFWTIRKKIHKNHKLNIYYL